MNQFSKKYGIPLAILIGGGWLVRLMNTFLNNEIRFTIVTITVSCILFSFGLSLNPYKKRNNTWVKKVIVSFFLIFFLAYQLGYLVFPQIKTIMDLLAIEGFVIYMIYIFCGWTFFS